LQDKRRRIRAQYTEVVGAPFAKKLELTDLYLKVSKWTRDVDSTRTTLTTLSDIFLQHEYSDDVDKDELFAHIRIKAAALQASGLCFFCVEKQALDKKVMDCSHAYGWSTIGDELFEPLARSSVVGRRFWQDLDLAKAGKIGGRYEEQSRSNWKDRRAVHVLSIPRSKRGTKTREIVVGNITYP